MSNDQLKVYRLFFRPGDVTEIRAFGLTGRSKAWDGFAKGDDACVFGYFDNAEAFGAAAEKLDAGGAHGIYFVPNLPDPALISRAQNRLVAASKKRPQTSDNHIKVVRWLLLDFDPVRPAGISATEEELAAAMECAKAAAELLREIGFAAPIKAASGNGYHLNYRIEDIECNEDYRKEPLVKRCLQALAGMVSNDRVKLDLAVFNPARIWKLYGTWARKGDDTKSRPHRLSRIFPDAPEKFEDVPVTPFAVLEKLAGMSGDKKAEGEKEKKQVPAKRGRPAKPERTNQRPGGLGPLKVAEYLAHFGREIHSVDDHGALKRYNLRECVFNPEHKAKDAAICQEVGGKLLYHCSHNSCQGRTWQDAKHAISGDASLKEWCEGYDPDWKPEDQPLGTGMLREIEIVPTHVEVGVPTLPPPTEIDPMEFFTVRGNGGRPAFVLESMAKYLATYFSPLVCTDGVFWRYADGCWRRFHDDTIRQTIVQALKDRVQADWIKSAMQVLGAMVNRLETQWTRRPYLINLKNGVIDLEEIVRAGKDLDLSKLLKPHDPEYGSRAQLSVEFDPEAEANRWIKFLWEVFPEGRECLEDGKTCDGDDKIQLAQQFAGYLLLPTCKFERAAFMVGPGANGKSTMLKVFINLLGKENTIELSLDDLARSFNIPYLQDKLLVTCTEMVTREPSAVSVLKKCISGDMVSGEHKYKQRIDFWPSAKFCFALNEVPNIVDKSYGFARKVLILRFDQRFEGEKKDVDLLEKLLAERNGIFLWMLEGAVDLIRRRGFAKSQIAEEERQKFLQEMNPFLMWVSERAEVGAGQKAVADSLYEDYRTWADKGGLKALGKIKFYHNLVNYLPTVKKGKLDDGIARRQAFIGIGLRGI
jgi:P4 family phage/plasmid primase-like protien